MDRAYRYSSTHVLMPPNIEKCFLSLGEELIQPADLFNEGLETDPHVTVLYGIHEDYPAPSLIDAIETHPKFTVTLGDVSLFEGNVEFDVVKVDVECDSLYVLRSALLNACHYTLTHPIYVPHATIAFVKNGSCKQLIGNSALAGMSFEVDSVIFSGNNDGSNRKIMLGVQ